jgi:ribosome biogenesis GTPase
VADRRHKRAGREKDLTNAYESGAFDEDVVESQETFGDKSKHYQRDKTARTQKARQEASDPQFDALPMGEVIQVFSLFLEVLHEGTTYQCVQRKTLAKISGTQIVVGDFVRFTKSPKLNDKGLPEGVIERIEPRKTILTRADSFKAIEQHPIVANADQMLIVAALHLPEVKWGLIDRMVVAARAGGLDPVVCLNKMDTATSDEDLATAASVLGHYESVGVRTVQTCAISGKGIDDLRKILLGKTTVLSGHSGVGKSSLVRAVEPSLNIRIGDISVIHDKGMHTTTSARRYPLTGGGFVVDTPGVKLFGLWNVTRESLLDYFPDVQAGTAPDWRMQSFERIIESLPAV